MENENLYKTLLNNFVESGFSNNNEKTITIFDISGFPHYENVSSNVLKFFFDTREEHGFGDAWIKSLLQAYLDKTKKEIPMSDLETEDVQREYSNGNEKRIDLLIRCGSIVVVIENKIYADSSYNPLERYNDSAENYANDNNIEKPVYVRIILSVFEQKRDDFGFINITYDEFFKKLAFNLNLDDQEGKWAIFAKDFIENIKNRKDDTEMKMDENWIKFVKTSGKNLGKFYREIDDSINERVSILKTINDNLNDLDLRKGIYNSRTETFVSQFNDVHMDDGYNVCVETYLMKYPTEKPGEDYDKLYVALWCRRNRHYDFGYILKALDKENALMLETNGNGSWGKHYVLNEYSLIEGFDVNEVSERIKGYLTIIKSLRKE